MALQPQDAIDDGVEDSTKEFTPCYVLRSAGIGKGFGVFAIRNIKAGQVIFSEEPVVGINRKKYSTYKQRAAELQKAVSKLPRSTQKEFVSLYNSYDTTSWFVEEHGLTAQEEELLGIFDTNCVEAGSLDAVFLKFSRLNHSCRDNVIHWPNGDNSYSMRASRNIKSGEELCVNYQSHRELDAAKERQSHQLHFWDFTCSCESCRFPSISDTRREKIGTLKKYAEEARSESETGALLSALIQAFQLREAEGILDIIESRIISKEIAQASARLGRPRLHTRKYARVWHASAEALQGPQHSETLEAAKCVARCNSHKRYEVWMESLRDGSSDAAKAKL